MFKWFTSLWSPTIEHAYGELQVVDNKEAHKAANQRYTYVLCKQYNQQSQSYDDVDLLLTEFEYKRAVDRASKNEEDYVWVVK